MNRKQFNNQLYSDVLEILESNNFSFECDMFRIYRDVTDENKESFIITFDFNLTSEEKIKFISELKKLYSIVFFLYNTNSVLSFQLTIN